MKMLANMVHMWYSLRWCHGTNYVPNEHEDVDQYDSFALPSDLMLYQSHPESLVNQNEILMKSLLSYRINELIWHKLCP